MHSHLKEPIYKSRTHIFFDGLTDGVTFIVTRESDHSTISRSTRRISDSKP